MSSTTPVRGTGTARDGSGDANPVSRTDRAQRHALDSMNHRPRRATTVMIVVAAAVLFGVLAYVGSKHSSANGNHTATTGHTTVPATAPGGASNPTSTRPKTKAQAKPTATTQPSQLVALTSTPTSATYPVVNSNYKVTATGTGTCWVSVTNSSGSTVWAGELQAGSVQVIPASGTVNVELGTPAVTLAVDKVPVVLPTPVRAPFVATFQPTAAAAAASPPTTSTTSPTAGAATSGSASSGPSVTSSTTPP